MYELIIIGLLSGWPLHGYLIAKITNDILGPYAKLSNGRLYPLLAQLTASGLITVLETSEKPTSGRQLRTYAITEQGRQRLHSLMMDTTSNLGDYSRLFWYKVPVMYFLTHEEQVFLVDHYINYCQTHVFHFIAEIEDMRAHPQRFKQAPGERYTSTIFVQEHMLSRWRLELDNAQALRARIVADSGGADAGAHAASSAASSSTKTTRSGEKSRHGRND